MMPKLCFPFLFWIGLNLCSQALAQQQSYIRLLGKKHEGFRIQLAAFPEGSCGILLEDSLQLIKTTPCGAILWSKRLDSKFGIRSSGVNSFCGTNNGGLAWVGQISLESIPQIDGFFSLTDSLGNIIAQKRLTIEGQNFYPYSIHQEKTGNFLVYGNLDPVGGGDASLAVFRLLANGEILIVRFWAHGGIWGGSTLLSEGGLITRSGSGFFKWDNNLQVTWGLGFPISGDYYESPVVVSGGFMLSKSGSEPGSFALYKISSDGQPLTETFASFPEISGKFRLISDQEGGAFGLFLKTKNGLSRPTIAHWDSNLKITSCQTLTDSDPNHFYKISDIQFNNKILWIAGRLIINDRQTPFFAKWAIGNPSACFEDDTLIQQVEPVWNLIQAFFPHEPQFSNFGSKFPVPMNPIPNFGNPYYCGKESVRELSLGNDTSLCGQQKIELKNQRNYSFSTYQWSTGNRNPTLIIQDTGKYWLHATDACEGTDYMDTLNVSSITLPEKPLADSILCQFNAVQLPGAPETWNGNWENGESGKTRWVDQPGKYTLQLDKRHCTQQWVFQVNECVAWELPNLLTANQDNRNETFRPKIWRGLEPGDLSIYNRWGETIWNNNQFPLQVWNPENQSDGIYYWKLNTRDKGKKAVTGNGWIQLLKSK